MHSFGESGSLEVGEVLVLSANYANSVACFNAGRGSKRMTVVLPCTGRSGDLFFLARFYHLSLALVFLDEK